MKLWDFYRQVTNQVIQAMNETNDDWVKAWVGNYSEMPQNATTKNYYSGVNILLLMCLQNMHGYPTAEWATFKQWEAAGYPVKKGETAAGRGQYIVKVGSTEKEDKATGEKKFFKWRKHYVVFNAAQVQGYDANAHVETFNTITPQWLHDFKGEMEKQGLAFDNGAPCYIPSKDLILQPKPEQYKDLEHYCRTLFHECGHATGHKSRLDRPISNPFGSRPYAIEELTAELCAVFMQAHMGMERATSEHSAQYLNNWRAVLEKDPTVIFSVASDAGAAATWLMDHGQLNKELAA